ncbi:hypothetical protein D3C86_1969760 [compost metagenome]
MPLSVLHINFTPKEFLYGNKFNRYVCKMTAWCPFVPAIVYCTDIVYGIEYNIDKIIPMEDFCKPSYVRQLGLITLFGKVFQNFRIFAALAEDVQIFGVSKDARVVEHGKSTA